MDLKWCVHRALVPLLISHVGIKEVCFSSRYFSREFDPGMVLIRLFNELYNLLSGCVPDGKISSI